MNAGLHIHDYYTATTQCKSGYIYATRNETLLPSLKPMQNHLSEFNAGHKCFHTLLQTCKTPTQHFPLCGQELQRQKYLEFVHQVFLVFIAKTLPALQPHMEHDRKFAEAFLFVPHAQSTNHEMAVKFVWEVNRLHAVKGLSTSAGFSHNLKLTYYHF
jgi:hypothetical protein